MQFVIQTMVRSREGVARLVGFVALAVLGFAPLACDGDREGEDGAAATANAGPKEPGAHLVASVWPAPGEMLALPPIPYGLVDKAAYSTNLIAHGGFESASGESVQGWTSTDPTVALTRSDAFAVEGGHALRITPRPDTVIEVRYNESIRTTLAAPYLLRGYVFTKDFDGVARLEVRDADLGASAPHVATEGVPGPSASWSLQEIEFEPPVSTMLLEVVLVVDGAANEGAAVWFDGVGLYQKKEPPRTNLLSNSGFGEGAKGLAHWYTYDTTFQSATVNAGPSNEALEGNALLHVRLDGALSLIFRQRVDGLVPGSAYVFQGYAKSLDLAGTAQLQVFDTASPPKPIFRTTEFVTGTTNWTRLRLEFTVPEGMTSAFFYLSRHPSKEPVSGLGELWFDGIELYKVEAAAGSNPSFAITLP